MIDQNGKPVPSQAFLNMCIVMIRNCEREMDINLIEFIGHFSEGSLSVESDFVKIRKELHQFMDEQYPPKDNKKIEYTASDD